MSNILIINGAKDFAHSKGELNNTLTVLAQKVLSDLGHSIDVSLADSAYIAKNEVEKFLWADVIIYQMPGWWMGAPWTVKKYIDDVFTEGHGSLYANDGRTRSDSTKKYGSGGLIKDKKYMLSLTWNAPEESFTDKTQFFEGIGIDGVYLPFHKANQFLGMQPMKTFLATDVIKAPNVHLVEQQYREHLINNFSF
ncbi:NAD(P)H-dependent oxidoreductase [Acinetobacter rudis]|uniref:NADPH:quinone oxidoreductase MdaB n=1 Tax=Acinetobacter rudis TaxID=632955 RepID=A0AAW8J7B0_9GAMM|nr:NAD(P)H-dependent oxidoreductase [Acinetobacter rudis]MDQ8935614.1 NAD(P)H-dependent oxidoreductase [Acinetobacter rudis]MDQ8953376.1 NAD(P)H-dependent oxidoreductase [Acinetobacter rudis]MDQ9017877.1 NAD(P)H-dependent oxidoreductase [Acinetobacter rudis]